MKVTINGPGVSPGSIHDVLVNLEKEYGAKIRDLTLYVRFVDEKGHTVDPKLPANGDELVMTIRKPALPKALTYDELREMVEKAFGRPIFGQGLEMILSWVDDFKLTKDEAAAVLQKVDAKTNLHTLERRILNLRRAGQGRYK